VRASLRVLQSSQLGYSGYDSSSLVLRSSVVNTDTTTPQTRTTAVLLILTFFHAMAFFAGGLRLYSLLSEYSIQHPRRILSSLVFPGAWVICDRSRRQVCSTLSVSVINSPAAPLFQNATLFLGRWALLRDLRQPRCKIRQLPPNHMGCISCVHIGIRIDVSIR